jgi:hypothetical protein
MSNIFYYQGYLAIIFLGIIILKGNEALTGEQAR